jgi:hypothetical protein
VIDIPEGALWRERWRALDPPTRHAIEAEVKRGRAMSSPAEAALAVGCALRWQRRARWGLVLVAPVVLVVTQVTARLFEGDFRWELPALYLLVLGAFTVASMRRARRAEHMNREAAARAPSLDPVGSDSAVLRALRRTGDAQALGNRPGGALGNRPGGALGNRPGGARPRPRERRPPDG